MRALSVLVFTAVGSVLAAPAVELSHLFDEAGIVGGQVAGDVERTIDDSGAVKPVATVCNLTSPQFLQQFSQCLAKDCAYRNLADFNALQAVCYLECHFKACGTPLGGSTDNNAGESMPGNNPTAGGDAGANPGTQGGIRSTVAFTRTLSGKSICEEDPDRHTDKDCQNACAVECGKDNVTKIQAEKQCLDHCVPWCVNYAKNKGLYCP